ncbi:Rsp5p-dependent ubiquitination, sorting of cargo proteins at the multivesicular body [Bacidia gigantensis]|uniref:Rsp5p-dependent ubiquitination, sorting of cargo proteins at the multivesicular body n=1 Tax=Bacidia gigantensis TaxID=2732470 RepID=UPI001D03BF5E|nr:Rsp5p-dependent ubiquitination, sorting of cargo proteins at the multivesicular body [Bacidia gigantensis]KAG8528837.1 Rsp5p-dependent ubiquitination, sorting of cargo proteins at the multivesicular body [Bacidia gigantensis]
MAQAALEPSPTFTTSYLQIDPSPTDHHSSWLEHPPDGTNIVINISSNGGSTGKGILIGMLSAFGSAAFVVLIFAIFYFFRYTSRGRIFLDRIGRPGEYDDEQMFAKEEADALDEMDDIQRAEYLRAKAFVQANPPETLPTDISLSQFLAIQEKGVSAWEFEPELEIANCFVEARTEIEFFDSECSVQSNLPIPKQNEVYYWEAKMYDKPESSTVNVGVSTKPYPLFRLPGYHKSSIAYTSPGARRYNQPFRPTPFGPSYVQGDVVGVGYRPRTGSIFFTRNGKKLDDVAHGLKSQNFFPTVGANGPCTVHVNFGQSGFVFIEANVKKWGLAPMTGSLAPPPPYGSEQGSILLEAGREANAQWGQSHYEQPAPHNLYGNIGQGHGRSRSGQIRIAPPVSPGPERSPTEISLAQLAHIPSIEDVGEGTSRSAEHYFHSSEEGGAGGPGLVERYSTEEFEQPPPEYTSPAGSLRGTRRWDGNRRDGNEYEGEDDEFDEDREEEEEDAEEDREHANDADDEDGSGEDSELLRRRRTRDRDSTPIPSYDAAVRNGR